MINTILQSSIQADTYHPTRTLYSVLSHATSELGEVAQEVAIASGDSYKQPSVDGVVGEAVDTIISLIDLIYKYDPTITEEQLAAIAEQKCSKWINAIKG